MKNEQIELIENRIKSIKQTVVILTNYSEEIQTPLEHRLFILFVSEIEEEIQILEKIHNLIQTSLQNEKDSIQNQNNQKAIPSSSDENEEIN